MRGRSVKSVFETIGCVMTKRESARWIDSIRALYFAALVLLQRTHTFNAVPAARLLPCPNGRSWTATLFRLPGEGIKGGSIRWNKSVKTLKLEKNADPGRPERIRVVGIGIRIASHVGSIVVARIIRPVISVGVRIPVGMSSPVVRTIVTPVATLRTIVTPFPARMGVAL